MKTYSAKPTEVERKWYIFDASELPLGRLSTVAATYLMGKHKPMYTAHIDCGDYIIIINADKLVTTGEKETTKMYYRHSQYPGGLKERTLKEQKSIDPTAVIRAAVRGMIPANKLRDERLARLKIYSGSEHQHNAQKPKKVSLKK